jgi:hypothetical protein
LEVCYLAELSLVSNYGLGYIEVGKFAAASTSAICEHTYGKKSYDSQDTPS